ncbi:hypothetical protein AB6A40_007071 [Gnathostoma spinigerum]|uniref:RING-type domain-containing protein n=1 Tax=Gnathostoma spinigerum TaxID=75299 RepID=A0ABD6EUW2_9BILA
MNIASSTAVPSVAVLGSINTSQMAGQTPVAIPASAYPSLSFVPGPTLTAGPPSASTGMLPSSPAYFPMPNVIESTFAQTAAAATFATPLVYPSTLATAYYPAAPQPSGTPCNFLSSGTPITAVCHCVYAQPCALHHRPISYAPRSVNSLARGPSSSAVGHSSHSHLSSSAPLPLQVPTLPPTLAPPLRSAAMRMKRPVVHASGPSSSSGAGSDLEAASVGHVQPKARRINDNREGSASIPTAAPRSENMRSSQHSMCCECHSRAVCHSCSCHHHCPQHTSCSCNPLSSTMAVPSRLRRETEINPIHDLILSSRMAQLERERQANNSWFHRQQYLAAGGLVGVDVVTRRVTPHPLVMFPRYHPPLMELSMVVLQPHETTVVVGGPMPASAEPLPVGASLEQIERFTTLHRFVKDTDLPETEQERCTVCLMNFETDEQVRSLRCAHLFHVGCIDRWLVYNKKCPVCRLDVDKTEIIVS